jgi:hypothetical protein
MDTTAASLASDIFRAILLELNSHFCLSLASILHRSATQNNISAPPIVGKCLVSQCYSRYWIALDRAEMRRIAPHEGHIGGIEALFLASSRMKRPPTAGSLFRHGEGGSLDQALEKIKRFLGMRGTSLATSARAGSPSVFIRQGAGVGVGPRA